MKKLNKNNKGFSLVELLVVIAIMVVLIGVVAPSLLGNIEKAREAKDIQALDTIAGNIQAAMVNEDVYDAVMAKNGAAISLRDAYKGVAFGTDTTLNSNVKLKNSLDDALSTKAVYTVDDATGTLKLFESKTAKSAINVTGASTTAADIYFKVDKDTGKVTVLLSTNGTTPVSGKSVDFEVSR